MLLAGMNRDGFRPATPQRRESKLTAIATTATIRNAKSRGSPKRSSGQNQTFGTRLNGGSAQPQFEALTLKQGFSRLLDTLRSRICSAT